VRPFGGTQNLYEFESEGIQKTHIIYFNSRLNLGSRIVAFLSYRINHTDQDYTGPTTFASNSYNLAQDYGRAPQPTQQLFAGGSVQLPFGIGSNLFSPRRGGTPFNITTGTDLNGDSIFNDRPAFATAPTANSVLYNTRFGSFDANPQPGEKTIPINYGNSPNFAFLDLSVNRTFKFGILKTRAVSRLHLRVPVPVFGHGRQRGSGADTEVSPLGQGVFRIRSKPPAIEAPTPQPSIPKALCAQPQLRLWPSWTSCPRRPCRLTH
jgi:hypothetical protein